MLKVPKLQEICSYVCVYEYLEQKFRHESTTQNCVGEQNKKKTLYKFNENAASFPSTFIYRKLERIEVLKLKIHRIHMCIGSRYTRYH